MADVLLFVCIIRYYYVLKTANCIVNVLDLTNKYVCLLINLREIGNQHGCVNFSCCDILSQFFKVVLHPFYSLFPHVTIDEKEENTDYYIVIIIYIFYCSKYFPNFY